MKPPKKSIKGLKLYGVIFMITLFVVLLVRTFLLQSYTVSSSQMEIALLKGDRVLVNKTAYGIRIPVTLLSIPFTFDRFLGFKSYSSLIELAYRRLFTDTVKRNDVVLFNNPLEADKPLDKRSLTLSRCVATPGDTIRVAGNDLFINGRKYIPSPDLLISSRFQKDKQDSIQSVMSLFDIPLRNITRDSVWGYISLSRYEMFIVNQKLSPTSRIEPDNRDDMSYSLLVPFRGMSITLTPFYVRLYGALIQQEGSGNSNISINDSSIIKDGTPLDNYQFNEDYYWFISDNSDDAVDSRTLGFVSERHIVGKASSIWYSSGKEGTCWDRIFTSVK